MWVNYPKTKRIDKEIKEQFTIMCLRSRQNRLNLFILFMLIKGRENWKCPKLKTHLTFGEESFPNITSFRCCSPVRIISACLLWSAGERHHHHHYHDRFADPGLNFGVYTASIITSIQANIQTNNHVRVFFLHTINHPKLLDFVYRRCTIFLFYKNLETEINRRPNSV